jgi:hypothetical protein
MALGINTPYTPFEAVSFGYLATELDTNYTTTGDVTVTITYDAGNFDDTGHISTPVSGNAVSTFNKSNKVWTVTGTEAEVDAILFDLKFYPADKPESRTKDIATNTQGWEPTTVKTNVTSGGYGSTENPPTIGDTTFDVVLSDSTGQLSSETITFEPDEPTYGVQRPFWSTEPVTEDLSSAAHGHFVGGLIGIGTISQLSDTDNLKINCQFRDYGTSTINTSTAYGAFMTSGSYIGGSLPETVNTTDRRLDFTGTKAEVQAYLDNVRFYRGASGTDNELAFDMFFTITNGVVGSTVTKTCYFSDAIVGVSTIPSQSFTEDSLANWDFDITTSNVQPDADTFKAEITLDSVGRGGVSDFTTGTSVTSQSYTAGTGVLEIIASSDSTLVTALRNLVFEYVEDFNTSFDMTVDLTYSSSSSGATYSSTQQTVTVTGIGVDEINNPTTSHTYTEDTVYDFSNGTYPQIIHAGNENFTVVFTHAANTGIAPIWRHGNVPSTISSNSTTFTMSGTRDEVNTGFQKLYYAPAADDDIGETITFTVDRTSGDLTHETQSTGSLIMTATAVGEYSITQLTGVDWYVDNEVTFDSGLAITDTAADDQLLPAYGSTYTVECAMFEDAAKTTAYTDGTLTSNTLGSITPSGNGQGNSTKLVLTGTKIDVNNALADMKFIPDCAEDTGPYINYKLIRNSSPSATFTDQSPSTRTEFNTGDATDYSYTFGGWTTWNEDTPKDFDCGVRIVDGAGVNSTCALFGTDYTATIQAFYWDGSADQNLTTATWSTTSSGSATVTGDGKSGTPLVIDGTKADVNTALENLRMTPDVDWTDAPSGDDRFYIYVDLLRNDDSLPILDGSSSSVFAGFEGGTPVDEYYSSVTGMTYTEDTVTSIFSGRDIGILDEAENVTSNVTYSVTITLSDSGAGEFVSAGSHTITLATDTKTNVNAAIQALQFSPTGDYETDVDIIYSQTRFVNGSSDSVQATTVNIGTVAATGTEEFTYGTANSNIQYYVADDFISGIDTTQSDTNILNGTANVTLTPKRMTLNKGLTYDRPITVTDGFEDGGASQYKVVFSGGTLLAISGISLNLTDTGWQTKADLHTLLDNGVYVTGFSDANANILAHDVTNTVNFTLHRKTFTGTESQIANGQLTYKHQMGLQMWFSDCTGTINNIRQNIVTTRIDNLTNSSTITLNTQPSTKGLDYLIVRPNFALTGSFGTTSTDYWNLTTHGELHWEAYDDYYNVWSSRNVNGYLEWTGNIPTTNDAPWASGNYSSVAGLDTYSDVFNASNYKGSVVATYDIDGSLYGSDTREFGFAVWTPWGAILRLGDAIGVGPHIAIDYATNP